VNGAIGRPVARCLAGIATAAPVMLLGLPTASARQFQMSGTWAIRNGQVFIPLQFAQTLGGSQMDRISLGYLSKGFGYPNGPIPGGGRVTATGSSPATLVVPRHRFRMQPSARVPLAGSTLVQITTMFEVDGPYEQAVLAPGGGPASFTWCPNDELGCPATGRPDRGDRPGRVIYRAGANRFGGAMRIGFAKGGINSYLFHRTPFQVGHVYFGATGPTPRAPIVGEGTPSAPGTRMLYLLPGVVTQPTMAPTETGLVLYPGPKLTTMLGLTTTGAGPTFRLPPLGVTPSGMSIGQSTSSYGFGHTTGTVIVQHTAGSYGGDFFTVMGYDARTPLGAGNLATVAGGVAFRNTLSGQSTYTSWHKVWFSLAPPVPSLSPAGLAAAGVLLLLAVGYARRRS